MENACVAGQVDTLAIGNVDGFGVKKCPVCGAGVFSDMGTCFSCMYKFAEGYSEEKQAPPATFGREAAGGDECLFNEFLIEFERFLVEFIANRRVNLE
jgi:hypothetical protein